MEHYLLRLAYTPDAWQDIVAKGASFDDRLDPVRKLLAQLGGAFASFHFFDTPAFADEAKRHVVRDKFAMLGEHDLMAIIAVPNRVAAKAFRIAIAMQPGVSTIELHALLPFEQAVTTAAAHARAAVAATGYRAAGPAGP